MSVLKVILSLHFYLYSVKSVSIILINPLTNLRCPLSFTILHNPLNVVSGYF